MIGRGLFIVAILSNCVLSLPVTSSQLENEDVKVMKCIVEALADVLSRPHPLPVSQECLVILRMDDRLVSILHHHNFLKELQSIAAQGGRERSQLQGDADRVTQTPQTSRDVADRSMLEALGEPGEKSILFQKKRTGNGYREGEKDESLEDEESQEYRDVGGKEEKREKMESLGSHVSEAVDDWSESKAEKREEEEEYEEKRGNSDENSEERLEDESMTMDKKGAASEENRHGPGKKSEEKKAAEEDEEEEDEPGEKKRSKLFSHHKEEEEEEEEEDGGEVTRRSRESLKQWTKRTKVLKKAGEKERKVLSSHSKEVTGEEEEDKRGKEKSLEEKELQMIAQRSPEEKRALEEEGSASRKSEEPDIVSLAAIESELENVAQKLHELSRG
ncbi:hypothetical protein LDENG_00260740 [Lucifuga dentata]|nr:hypothetical protein LDENG_00260740 [Lucifuga dentata]